jgi:hypothetical protein
VRTRLWRCLRACARLRVTPRPRQVPANGLVLYTGTILTDEGKEKKVNIDFEPFKTINTSLYLCDNKFHTEALSELLESENKYGFIVMDGNGSLFGTLSGNTREILHKFSVDLPKKHGRGGQSALRFARLRMEKRHNYVRKVRGASGARRPGRFLRIGAAAHARPGPLRAIQVAEMSVQFYITNDKVRPHARGRLKRVALTRVVAPRSPT